MTNSVPMPQPLIRRRTGGRSGRIAAAVKTAVLTIMQTDNKVPTVDELAKIARVQRSTIYRRWGTVEGVVLEAVRDRLETVIPVPDTGSARKDLETFLGVTLAHHLSPMGAILTRLIVGASEEFKSIFWTVRLKDMRQIIERGQSRGEISTDIDPHIMWEMMLSPFYFRPLVSAELLNQSVVDEILKVFDLLSCESRQTPRQPPAQAEATA